MHDGICSKLTMVQRVFNLRVQIPTQNSSLLSSQKIFAKNNQSNSLPKNSYFKKSEKIEKVIESLN